MNSLMKQRDNISIIPTKFAAKVHFFSEICKYLSDFSLFCAKIAIFQLFLYSIDYNFHAKFPCAFREHHRTSLGLRWAFDVYIKTSLPLCKSAQESHNIKCRSDR